MKNVIRNEDCLTTMDSMDASLVNAVITSPPYNTSRIGRSDKNNTRYNGFSDNLTEAEYIDWTVEVFNGYDKVLKQNGVVLYNLSYSSEKTALIWLVIAEVISRTSFTTADCIVWKKKSAIPNNRSSNKLTRICEFVFVFCRKTEISTFQCNKKVCSLIEKTGQKNYENVYNIIEAANNDGSVDINKATYSTEFVSKLLNLYCNIGDIVYDSFMGTGTTAVACVKYGVDYIGSELSEEQCIFAEKRVANELDETALFGNFDVSI